MKRALVLGGGGPIGIAWETAIAAGLLDEGLDVREADLIIGTSAGSVVGTHLAHGRDPRETLAEPPRENTPRAAAAPEPDMAQLTAIFQLWASFDRMTPERCAQIGRLALEAKTAPEDVWVQGFADINFGGWPQKQLLLTAVDCESGDLAVWERDSGVPIERAVASSCSVPGMFPPVTINGHRYTDGGVRSGTSADLAQRIEPDAVLIISTMGSSGRGIGQLIANQLAAEKGELEAVGANVRIVMFDEATKQAAGPNLMDASRRPAVIETGRAQGRRIATELREIWSPR